MRPPGLGRWLGLPLLWLVLFAAGAALAITARAWIPALLLGGLLIAWFVWVLVSTLTPGRADRRCPSCGAESLAALEPGNPLGVRCSSCGYEDPSGHVAHLEEE
jgi:hypothetical protein